MSAVGALEVVFGNGFSLQRIHLAIVAVEFRLHLADREIGRRTQKPGAQVAFIDPFGLV